ncbi:MAG: protein translocase subunit SecD [Candidatus Paceibacterales bacterium]
MFNKKKTYITLSIILILTFFIGNLSYSKYFNRGIDYINSKFNLKLPHFWDIPFKLGLDLQGGIHLVYEANLSNIEKKDYSSLMEGLKDIIERRVNLFGVEEPVVQVEKAPDHYRLIVELAGIKSSTEAIKMIGQTPFLEFREQRSSEETQKILAKQKEIKGKSEEEIKKIENWQLAFEDPYFKSTILTGRYLKTADLRFSQTAYRPIVSLQFNDEGSKIFEDLTSRNVGKPLAIYIDQVLISAPVVQETISGGRAQITGKFTVEGAKKLARDLESGALPVPIKLVSQQLVGPILGMISLERSLKAGVIGFLVVVLFLIIFYRLPGILASLALIVYIAINLTIFKLIPVTLTLAGIAGFILSIGMAIDANILIFSRMREELREERSYGESLEEGSKLAWPSIRDGNFTTILVGLILFGFGTSFVKGLAFTLIIGNLVSLFSAVFITNTFLECFRETKFENWKWLWK